MNTNNSEQLFRRARNVLVGGVNSPVRSFAAVGGSPLFISKAEGSHAYDADGNRFIDYVASWGPLILGHSHPSVIRAVENRLPLGTSFGAPCELETDLAELIVRNFPSIEKVRLTNSGTEATMSAIRLARANTGREYIVKLGGVNHGIPNSRLSNPVREPRPSGIPAPPGFQKRSFTRRFREGYTN